MSHFNNNSYKRASTQVLYEQVIRSRERNIEDKPIKVKHGNRIIVIDPTNPMYKVTKWYGKYE